MGDKYSIKGNVSYNEAMDIAVRLCAQLPDTVVVGSHRRKCDRVSLNAPQISAPQCRIAAPGPSREGCRVAWPQGR
jgi:hypothetical protein